MEEIDQHTVRNVLGDGLMKFVRLGEWNQRFIMTDRFWLTTSAKFVHEAIVTDPLLKHGRYEDEVFDCDDFALSLKTKMAFYAHNNRQKWPFAIGFILTQKHAYNFCIEENHELVLLNTEFSNLSPERERAKFSQYLDIGDPNTSANYIQLIYI
jgi:hypothetical protein